MQTSHEIAHAMRNTLWMFESVHPEGLQPGSFMHHLLWAVARADNHNRARLAEGFPDVVWAVDTLQHDEEGYTKVLGMIRELEAGEPQ